MTWETLVRPELVTRSAVTVSRDGWVTSKQTDTLIGLVSLATTADGRQIWRASSGDISSWSDTRAGAVAWVLELWNMREKARAYDRAARRSVGVG